MRSLIVNACLCNGCSAWVYSSYCKRLLILVVVMYVDDTNLVHWSSMPSCTPAELIAAAQTATYVWGGLAIATGAAMKPEKCYVYFLSYWCDCGWVKLRTVKALPDSIAPITLLSGEIAPSHLRVPLPNGTSALIPTLQNKHASLMLMLGIYFDSTSGGSTHIREMAKKVMRGPTVSDLNRSLPTLHGRVLSTSSNPEWCWELLLLFNLPRSYWNISNGFTSNVSITWTWSAILSSLGGWYQNATKGLAWRTLPWFPFLQKSPTYKAIGDSEPPL